MDAQNHKNVCSKVSEFLLIFLNARKNTIKSALLFYIVQREDAHREPQFNVEIEDITSITP